MSRRGCATCAEGQEDIIASRKTLPRSWIILKIRLIVGLPQFKICTLHFGIRP
jgi:hypothetical protein